MFDSGIKKYECKIRTLSPIHIGSGNKYSTAEYVSPKAKSKSKDKNVQLLRRVNFDKYYSKLSDDKVDEFLENITNYNFKLEEFDSNIPKEFKRYDCINKTSNKSPNEVVEHIRTIDELFIPGSSLKGAIKTALFYNKISRNDFQYIEKRLIKKHFRSPGKNIIDKRNYAEFENKIFSSKFGGDAAKYNISKFLQVSDSTSLKIGDINEVIIIKAKENAFNGGFQQHKIHGNPVSTFIETIPAKPKKYSLKSIISTNFNSKTYKGLNLDDKSAMIDIDNIKSALYEFSKDLIQHELGFYDKYGEFDGIDLEKFYMQINKLNKKEAPLVKLGSGAGFLATTINLKIKEYHSQLFEEIRKTAHKSYRYEYPKSRRIVKRINRPLGWVKLKIKEI
jgi:CRISPR type III-A-associated RAMP protein Csm5